MKAPLITAVDTALTGAGQLHNDSFFLRQLEKTGLISRHELQRLVVGDLGGGLVESDGAKSHPHLNLRFKDVASQLLGVRLHHYQEIASRAANNPLNGLAGVILLALNGNKADIVVEAVRRHNHLFAVQGEIDGNAFVPYSALRLGRDTIAIGRVVGGNDRAHRTKLAQFVVQAVPPFGERNEAAAVAVERRLNCQPRSCFSVCVQRHPSGRESGLYSVISPSWQVRINYYGLTIVITFCKYQHHNATVVHHSMKKHDKASPIRKSVTMPSHMWDAVAQFQKTESIATEAEALRRVVLAGIRALAASSGLS
jgi:hypothetical protein